MAKDSLFWRNYKSLAFMTNTGEAVEELRLGFTGERKFRKGLIVFGPTSDKYWL